MCLLVGDPHVACMPAACTFGRGAKGVIKSSQTDVPALSYEPRRVDKAASGARAHGARVSFGGCARRRAGSRPTQRSRPVHRCDVARRTPFASSRCAHAHMRKMHARIAGEPQERAPSGGAYGGSAAQPGHQEGLAALHTHVLPARASGMPGWVFHGVPAWRLQPCSTTLTIAVSRVAAPHLRSVGRQRRHHHLRHPGGRRGRSWLEDRRLHPPPSASMASAGCCWRL